jgi:ABC-type antimicrobial peptide transport system permease subunit
VPLQHLPNEFRVTFAIRTTEGAKISVGELRDAIQSIDAQAQLSELRTVEERLDRNLTQERLMARLAGFFGAFALAFAGLGLFGMMSYAVAARTKEFGVRMALGSTPGAILGRMVKQGVWLGLIGCGFGALGAFGLTKFVASLLFGVQAQDPLSFFAAGGVLLLVVAIAAAIPARRAAKVDPMVALRCE